MYNDFDFDFKIVLVTDFTDFNFPYVQNHQACSLLCCCPTYLLQYISNAVISPAHGIAVDLLHTNY